MDGAVWVLLCPSSIPRWRRYSKNMGASSMRVWQLKPRLGLGSDVYDVSG